MLWPGTDKNYVHRSILFPNTILDIMKARDILSYYVCSTIVRSCLCLNDKNYLQVI